MREGELWFLSTEDKVDPVNFSLYINGFSFWHEEQETAISLSPFALVRNCKFQSTYPSLGSLSKFKIFKVSLFAQGRCYYFGVTGTDEHQAEEERSRWVLDISRAMRLVTQSLFPPFNIVCNPLPDVASTQRRLMAGYLIHCDDGFTASVLYCELHPHCEDKAKMVLYENELCQTPVMDVYITERSTCCEKIGINCSCFSIEEHQFSTRSLSERKLWLRAISNLKVKLQNRAPTPELSEIRSYRTAIKDHLETLKGALDGQICQTDALLQRSSQQRKLSPPPAPYSMTPVQAVCKNIPLPKPEAQDVPFTEAELEAASPMPPTMNFVPSATRGSPTGSPQPMSVPMSTGGIAGGGDSRDPVLGVSGPRLAVLPTPEEMRQPGDG